MKDFKDLLETYDIDFGKLIGEIETSRPGRVLLQFVEGFKPYATSFVDFLEEKFPEVEFIIWLGDCYGACDTPVGLEGLGIDVMFQIGHNPLQPCYLRD